MTPTFQHHYKETTQGWRSFLHACIMKALESQQIKPYAQRQKTHHLPEDWIEGAYNATAVTVCYLLDDAGDLLGIGYAFCTNPVFREKQACQIAQGRAEKYPTLTLSART